MMSSGWPSLIQIEAPRTRYAILGACGTFACLGLAAAFHWDPATTTFFPLCPIRTLTGFYCPGCGMTRGLHQLLHGNIAAALAYNPLIVLVIPAALYWLLSETILVCLNRELPRPRPTPRLLWTVLIAVIAFGVLRNVPYYPFTLLAPH